MASVWRPFFSTSNTVMPRPSTRPMKTRSNWARRGAHRATLPGTDKDCQHQPAGIFAVLLFFYNSAALAGTDDMLQPHLFGVVAHAISRAVPLAPPGQRRCDGQANLVHAAGSPMAQGADKPSVIARRSAQVGYRQVKVEADPDRRHHLNAVTGGDQSVPCQCVKITPVRASCSTAKSGRSGHRPGKNNQCVNVVVGQIFGGTGHVAIHVNPGRRAQVA
ncbi:MAG: hypothetical protein ACI83P_001730 [Janthinobacterium sp.]|jgi:hypothetical protein